MNAVQITEVERPLHPGRPANPRAEVWQLLRGAADARRAAQAEYAEQLTAEHDRSTRLLLDVVGVQHQLQVFLQHKRARLVAAGLEAETGLLEAIEAHAGSVVRRAGAVVMGASTLDGQRFDPDAMEPFTEVIAAVPTAGIDTPCIRETVTPGVVLGADLLQRARIVLAVPPIDNAAGRDGHGEATTSQGESHE